MIPVDGTERQAEVIKEAGQVLQATLQDCASLTSWGKSATSPQAFAPRRNLPAVLPTRAARISATSKRVSSHRRHCRQGNLRCDRERRRRHEPAVTPERTSCT